MEAQCATRSAAARSTGQNAVDLEELEGVRTEVREN